MAPVERLALRARLTFDVAHAPAVVGMVHPLRYQPPQWVHTDRSPPSASDMPTGRALDSVSVRAPIAVEIHPLIVAGQASSAE